VVAHEGPAPREACAHQQRLGYKIVPINPMLKEVLNEPAYPSLAAVTVPVDVVQVFRSKDQVIPVAEESASRCVLRPASWTRRGAGPAH